MSRFAALISVLLFSFSGYAANSVSATCVAYGKNNVGGNDTGAFLSDSILQLRLEKQKDGAVLATIEGKVKAVWAWDSEDIDPKDIKDEDAYVGGFKLGPVANNPKYRPTRYKGYIQFKDIDANETFGRESGMWGELVVSGKAFTDAGFHAAYIFQAGDHMGGTLHFTCAAN